MLGVSMVVGVLAWVVKLLIGWEIAHWGTELNTLTKLTKLKTQGPKYRDHFSYIISMGGATKGPARVVPVPI